WAAARPVEVLPDGQVGEDPPVSGHEADPRPRHAIRRPPRDVRTLPHDSARARRRQSHDRPHRRGLADAVASEEADAFAGADLEGDAEEDAGEPVRGVEVANLEDHGGGAHRSTWGAQTWPPPPPPPPPAPGDPSP